MDLGAPELLIILIIVIVVFGVGRIGALGGEIGEAIREFRKGLASPRTSVKDSPGDRPPKNVSPGGPS